MKIVSFIILILFIGILIKQVHNLKELIIPTRKSAYEIVEMIIGVAIFSGITYAYKSQWYHYLFFVVVVAAFIAMCFNHGISSRGFLSQYFYFKKKDTDKIIDILKEHGKELDFGELY
ncbi:hypothetical protein [Inconstantimicrobium porci]|uniref:hypothetical protein n=1 Tax=Inconstantimicrobium porci TaxID=2652291 RepID=UPI0024091FA1|nr:hypothetical protein [Inconstantimicrobium porci]MDD6769862.1 hypothetical protein [Inconstantimicrobium porci]